MPRNKYDFPQVRRDNREELLFDNGSRIQCVVAGTKELGRGNTYQYVLLSEFAFFDDQEGVLQIEQSLAHVRLIASWSLRQQQMDLIIFRSYGQMPRKAGANINPFSLAGMNQRTRSNLSTIMTKRRNGTKAQIKEEVEKRVFRP